MKAHSLQKDFSVHPPDTVIENIGVQHPLSVLRLDRLLSRAALLYGAKDAIAEAGAQAAAGTAGNLTYDELDQAIAAFANGLRECGLSASDRILVLGTARTGTIIAILGALHAGMEPVVAPLHMSAGALAFLAQSAGAAALFGPSVFGDLNLEMLMQEIAASAPDVRILGSLGPGSGDGAIDFSPSALLAADKAAAMRGMSESPEAALPRIGLVQRGEGRAPRILFMAQSKIIAQAMDIAHHLGLSPENPLVSTLSPASLAGLVAGPVAALLAGAPISLLSPFDATEFVLLLDRLGPCHLLSPEAISGLLEDAGLMNSAMLASLTFSCSERALSHAEEEAMPVTNQTALLVTRLSVRGDGSIARN